MGQITFYNRTGFEGDINKNGCNMTSQDIDNNFYTLKGEDIKNAYWDNANTQLVIEFYNGETIQVGDIDPYKLQFDPEKQALVGKLSGDTDFIITSGVITDGSIEGDNTFMNPLSVAKSLRTGFVKPISKVVSEYPESGESRNNERVLIKLSKNKLGRLYTAEEVELIKNELEETPWKVAEASDWNSLLNSCECDTNRTHGEDEGVMAGAILKDNRNWDGYDAYNFSVLPYSGESAFYAGDTAKVFKTDDDKVYNEEREYFFVRLVKKGVFHEHENILGTEYQCVKCPCYVDGEFVSPAVWTAENIDLDKINGKTIGIPVENVVKDYYVLEYDAINGLYEEIEMEEGESVYSIEDNVTYTVRYNGDEPYLVTAYETFLESVGDSYYNKEDKTLQISFNNTDDIVSLNLDKLIEVIDEKVANSDISSTNKISDLRTALEETIELKESESKARDEELNAKIYNLSETFDNALNEAKNEAKTSIVSAVTVERLSREEAINKLSANTTDLMNTLDELSAAIEEEKNTRIARDNDLEKDLEDQILNETTARKNADNALDTKIGLEETARKAKDAELESKFASETSNINTTIQDEITARAAADHLIEDKITAEVAAREKNEAIINGKIDVINTELNEHHSSIQELGSTVNAVRTALDAVNALIKISGVDSKAIEDLENMYTALEGKIESGDTSLREDIAAEAEERISGDTELQIQINEVKGDISDVRVDIEDSITKAEQELDDAINDLESKCIDSANTINAKIDQNQALVDNDIETINSTLDNLQYDYDVKYDDATKKVYLTYNQSGESKTTFGFDASIFTENEIFEDAWTSGSTLYMKFTDKEEPVEVDLSEVIGTVEGKVKDVQVNGVSVLDENGVANIPESDGKVKDVQVNGVSVLDEDGVAIIGQVDSVTTEKITVGDTEFAEGTPLQTIIEESIKKNEDTEYTTAAALNYLYQKMQDLHPGGVFLSIKE